MIWDDLLNATAQLLHNVYDLFYSLEYIFSQFGNVFAIIFTPLNFAFNFVKGFFDGIGSTPPTTELSYSFDSSITAIFNTIPHWSLFMWAIGAGLSVLVIGWIAVHILKL